MDSAIVRFLNSGVGKLPLLDTLIEALVSDYLVPVAGSLALLGFWFSGRAASRPLNQTAVITAAAAIGIANLVTGVVDSIVGRSRPFAEHNLNLLFYQPTDPSFPSNAAAVGFALATPIFLRRPALGSSLYILAFLWGFSRVYAGVHYPSDILAGALIGVAAGLLMAAVFTLCASLVQQALRLMRLFFAA